MHIHTFTTQSRQQQGDRGGKPSPAIQVQVLTAALGSPLPPPPKYTSKTKDALEHETRYQRAGVGREVEGEREDRERCRLQKNKQSAEAAVVYQ